jgi:hypothetical protein
MLVKFWFTEAPSFFAWQAGFPFPWTSSDLGQMLMSQNTAMQMYFKEFFCMKHLLCFIWHQQQDFEKL